MICHSTMRICIRKPLYSCHRDAVVRSTQNIFIECTLNFSAISSILKKCICGIRPLFFKDLYGLRPNNHGIIMTHLRKFWFIVFGGVFWARMSYGIWFCFVCQICPLTCQCSKNKLELILPITWEKYYYFWIFKIFFDLCGVFRKADFPRKLSSITLSWPLEQKVTYLANWQAKSQQPYTAFKPKTGFTNLKIFTWINVQADWNICFNLMCEDAGYSMYRYDLFRDNCVFLQMNGNCKPKYSRLRSSLRMRCWLRNQQVLHKK